jgi:DNA-binding Lrp family transcriptional regulator
MNLKNEDLQIISYLRKDSRASLTKMSRKTQIPVSTIFDKLKNRTNKVIKKNTCIIDFNRLGMNTRAKVVLKVRPEDRNEIKQHLLKNRHVNSLYKINNGYDYMADVVFSNLKELESFLEDMDDKFKIKMRHVYYVIDEIECEKFLSEPEMIEILDIF